MEKYLVGIYQSYSGDDIFKLSVSASLYNSDNSFVMCSGIQYFIIEAESEEDAVQKGRINYQEYKKASDKFYEEFSLKTKELNRKYKVFGYHLEETNV